MLTINKNFLQEGPVHPNQVSEIIQSTGQGDIGAHSIFLGQVRSDHIKNQNVTIIEYSAYDEMVNSEMQKIISEVTDKYNDLKRIYILHSRGAVRAGEISLFVFVGCGHRIQSFEAVADIVNLIKERIPIWKKEYLGDDSYIWTENNT